MQPAEVVEFFEDLVSLAGFTLETAGALAGGRRIWALAKTNYEANIAGQDLLKGYLLLATSYDGTFATTASLTDVRVVCQNTLRLSQAISGGARMALSASPTFVSSTQPKSNVSSASWTASGRPTPAKCSG